MCGGRRESHYKLAKADLEEFGETVDPHNPPEPVQRFHDYWQSLADQHASAYLGVLYVAENIAKHASGSVIEMFPKLQLTRAQTRWLRVHAEVDLEHGAEVQEMCARYMDKYEAVITAAAAKMTQFWIDIMHEGFYGKAPPGSSSGAGGHGFSGGGGGWWRTLNVGSLSRLKSLPRS